MGVNVAQWIGCFVGNGPDVKVVRTKRLISWGKCPTLTARKMTVQKKFRQVKVEITSGTPPSFNDCKGVIHGVEL